MSVLPDSLREPTATAPAVASDRPAPRSGLRRIAAISASLVGTYALTSVLGLAFWLLAARAFPLSSVGVGGAAVALMTVLGALGTCGLGTLLIDRLPHTAAGDRRVLVRTSLAVAGVVGTLLAVVVPLVAIGLLGVDGLQPIAGTPGKAALLAVGTGLMAVSLVVDQAVLVIGSGALQLERNAVASVTKLVALAGFTAVGATDGMDLFAAWTIGTLVSLPLVAWRTRGGRALQGPGRLVELSRLRGLARAALSHHALNTSLQATLQVLPLIVLVAVSSEQNGVFTTVLQVTGAVFLLPFAISIALFASSAGDVREVVDRMRFTVPVSLGISVLANLLIFPLAPYLLLVFGSQYADQGVDILRVVALAGLPFVVKDHYVALRRVQGRTGQATRVMVLMTVVELAAAYVGVRVGDTFGLAVAWVGVLVLEAFVLAVPLLRARSALDAAPTARVSASTAATTVVRARSPRLRPVLARLAGADVTLLPGAQADPADRPSRASRVAAAVGPGPAVLLMACGLLPMARAVSGARADGSDATDQTLWVLGLAMIFLPAALGAFWPRLRGSTRIVLAVSMVVLLQLSRVVLFPTRFMFHDELVHATVLRTLDQSGQLFGFNSLLPVTSYYPGLEIATDAVQSLSGLSAHTSAAVVLVLARIVLGLAVLLLVRRVTGSTRIGAGALVVYACNPQMLFFNSQFSYQTLALPLAVLSVYLVLSRRRDSRLSLLPAMLATIAVAISHHVTAGLLVLTFVVWWLVELVLRRRGPRTQRTAAPVGLMALTGALALGATLLNPGNPLGSYLGAIATSSAEALDGVVTGGQRRTAFQNSAGVVTQPWEKYLMIASVLLTLAVLLPALWRSRRLLRLREGFVVVLILVGLLYPIIPGGHITVSTAEVGDRSAGFVFLGVGFVVAWWAWQHRMRWWKALPLALGATVVFLGSVVLGAGSVSQQLPGPFRVSDDARSVDADNLAATSWMARNLPAHSTVYADRVGGLLASAYGDQTVVRHIGSDVDASRLLLDPAYGQADVRLIRETGIRYLVADRRDAFGLPNQGVYIENGEFGQAGRTQPVPAAALRKFSDVPGVDVVYDNGSVVIYDLEALDAPK